MKIKPHKDYWTAEEITNIVTERTGKVAGVAVKPGEITLDLKDLPDHERVNLETYFGADHDLPTVVEKVSEEARREALVARVRKFTDGTSISVRADDMRDALGALAELVGVDVGTAKDAK